jgi:hypothetical protein
MDDQGEESQAVEEIHRDDEWLFHQSQTRVLQFGFERSETVWMKHNSS